MRKNGKVKGFIERHWKKIVFAGVGCTIGYVAGVNVVCKAINKVDTNIDIPGLTIADFGRVGEEIVDKCPGVTPDTIVKAWRVCTPNEK